MSSLDGAAATGDRAAYTAECFARTADAEEKWLVAVRGTPVASSPALYRRAWHQWNDQAGMP